MKNMTSLAPIHEEIMREEKEGSIFQSCPLLLVERTSHDELHRTVHLSKPHFLERNVATSHPKRNKNKSSSSSSSSSSWDIGTIESLPDAANIYPLEKTRITLKHNTSPNKVVQNILTSLKDQSIPILSKKRNKLLAESIDLDVRFCIKLYKAKEQKEDGEYGIMVELQKRRGCSLSFAKVAHVILQNVKTGHLDEKTNKGVENKVNEKQICTTCSRLPLLDEAALNTNDKEEEEKYDLVSNEIIQHAVEVIQDEHMDVSLLGMQELVLLTNTKITHHNVALNVAKAVLPNKNDDGDIYDDNDFGLNPLILKFLYGDSRDYYACEEKDSYEYWHHKQMHYYALTILANSLQIQWEHCLPNERMMQNLQTNLGTDNNNNNNNTWLQQDALLPLLIHKVSKETAEMYPHEAHQAMRCLHILLFRIAVPSILKRALDLGVLDAICKAREVGRCCHFDLEQEAEVVIKAAFGCGGMTNVSEVAMDRSLMKHDIGAMGCVI